MTEEDYPGKEDIVTVLITEFLVIFIINAFTITGFARIRHLRQRSTYLIINLTVADLLVGAITGPLFVYRMNSKENSDFIWPGFIMFASELAFPIASQVNLCLISLDRRHATLFPFRHCLIGNWVYFKIIIVSWFTAFLLASLLAALHLSELDEVSYAWASFCIITILVLSVSHVIIILNVQSSPHLSHHGLIHTERKLSVTLIIVTGASVLTILPWVIYSSRPVRLREELSNTSGVNIHDVLAVIYFASSVVNPLVYAIRMQEFRKAIGNLICKSRDASTVIHYHFTLCSKLETTQLGRARFSPSMLTL